MADTTVGARAGMSVVDTEEGILAPAQRVRPPAQRVQPALPARTSKKVDYRRYLMEHHRNQPGTSSTDRQ